MANTISTKTYRDKYRLGVLDTLLRNALIAEKVCTVDRSDAKTIQNPYGSQPTVTVQALAGTYTPADFTTTDDTLTVTDEFIVAEHVKDFEQTLARFDLFANRTDEMAFAVASKVDRYVINNLCEDATGSYTTPVGGFSASNTVAIMANLIGKVSGYSESYRGLFLVVENTDVAGLVAAGAVNGFQMADDTLNNGFINRFMGIDIYVVRSGTFADETLGTKTYTNAGHRVFGVKGVATYAAPRGVQVEELMVSGKTGKEVRVFGYIGFKLWATKSDLVVDITLA
jgi:hypothetical protein